LLWQRISYEAQRIDCGVAAKGPRALNALSASTEAGWIVSFTVSLKICRALQSVKLIGTVIFYPVTKISGYRIAKNLGCPVNR